MERAKKIDTILFDLDGTLYFKGKPVEKAVETLNKLREQGYKLSFLTNTDGRTVEELHKRITNMGFDIRFEELYTPITAALAYLKKNPGKSCYCLMRDEIKERFRHIDMNDVNPDYVIMFDCEDKASYDEFNKVFRFVTGGAQILASTRSMCYYTVEGINLHTGAFVKMFEEAAGTEAVLLGKPSKDFFQLALDRLGSEAERTILVGDDITVDVAGAEQLGAHSALVRTGHFTEETLAQSRFKPENVIDTVAGILDIL